MPALYAFVLGLSEYLWFYKQGGLEIPTGTIVFNIQAFSTETAAHEFTLPFACFGEKRTPAMPSNNKRK